MDTFFPSTRTKCTVEGCTKDAGATGRCRDHERSKRRASTSDGINTGRPKLTDEQVTEARRMRSAFKSLPEIAQHFGVTVDTIRSYLRTGKGRQS